MNDIVAKIFILGIGNVGSSLLDIIKKINPKWMKVIRIASSKKMLFKDEGIDLSKVLKNLYKSSNDFNLDEFLAYNDNYTNKILVDCTADEFISKQYVKIINKGFSIVTANKIANALDQNYYCKIRECVEKNNVQFRYETNVGGGLPIISTIRRLVSTGDRVLNIQGVLSGTLSYLFSEFNGQVPFSKLLLNANKKGFTEPDPRNDLMGLDVARKILILIREVGYSLDLDDINVKSLIPAKINEDISVEQFFEQIESYDNLYKMEYQKAKLENKVLRYIASWDTKNVDIGLRSISIDNPFYFQKGRENFIIIKTNRYNKNPIIIKGHGAGASVTAAGVFYDIKSCVFNYL